MSRARKIFALSYVAVHLFTALFLNIGHTDVLEFSGACQTLTTHDCGAHERHKPIPADHFCPTCYRAANFAANTPERIAPAVDTQFAAVSFQPRASITRLTDYYTSASKRGPPSPLA